MLALFKKEIQSFFTSPIGYLIVGLFLLLCGLFLWVFKGTFNVFENGFADLGSFFLLTPWVFLFLIPAITMRSFSEEKKMGTLELLYIKPISFWNIIWGKFFGALALCIIAVIPTLLYVLCISALGIIEGNFDSGVIIGSYFGLLFLMAMFVSIGLFSSTLTENQIVAFIIAIALSFGAFYGFASLTTLFNSGSTREMIAGLGAKSHFESIARGIIDTRDLVYFVSVTAIFLILTHIKAQKMIGR